MLLSLNTCGDMDVTTEILKYLMRCALRGVTTSNKLTIGRGVP